MKIGILIPGLVIFTAVLSRGTVFAQGGPAPLQSQAEQVQGSMQDSLQRQQASIEAFRNSMQTGSLEQQRRSTQKQYASVHKVSLPDRSIPVVSDTQAQVSDARPSESAFFNSPWPASAPLSVPNVQVVGDSCEALKMDDVEKLVAEAGRKHGVDSALLKSVMRQESGFKPCALSVAGAMGLMQIMPATAETLRLDDPFDAAQNVDAGAKFLRMMLDRYQGDLPMALGAYNAGPGRVDKAGGVPPIPETIDYVEKVLGGMPLAY